MDFTLVETLRGIETLLCGGFGCGPVGGVTKRAGPFGGLRHETQRVFHKSSGPKGRRHVAWGASPRNRAPNYPQAPEGRRQFASNDELPSPFQGFGFVWVA